MKKLILSDFLFMRLLVGYLGEKYQFNWWPTTFIGPSSNLFLSPVFPRTTLLSQYHGILEAARRVHDERIGVGSVFHLFRLPEVREQELHGILSDGRSSLSMESFASRDAALAALQKIADGDTSASEGPVKLGSAQEILTSNGIRDISRSYTAAFTQGVKCYPYFVS
jgi:hypothetical protein